MSIPVSVFYCQLSSSDDPETFERLLRTLPGGIQNAIARYTDQQDRRLRIVGKALLQYGLRHLDPLHTQALELYRYPEGKKPFLLHSAFRFSISHSGDVVLCAITKAPAIGADVEQITRVEPELLQAYFNEEQWQKILQATDIEKELYRQWTIKEAALKAWGIPIGEAELKDISIDDNTVYYAGRSLLYHTPVWIPCYAICLAGVEDPESIRVRPVALPELFG